MAEKAFVALLRRDPTAWSSFRLRVPEARVDLRSAELSGIVLKEVNLNVADLQGASLREADVDSALFLRANLSGAALRHRSPVRILSKRTCRGHGCARPPSSRAICSAPRSTAAICRAPT